MAYIIDVATESNGNTMTGRVVSEDVVINQKTLLSDKDKQMYDNILLFANQVISGGKLLVTWG